MNNSLVKTCTSDGLYLHGYHVESSDKKTVLLLIHGLEGNFYEIEFVHTLSKELDRNDIGFLSVNTRGNGKITDFNTKDDKIVTIGSWNELLEEAHLDISAWIEFLISENYENIILSGHSLGTFKVVRYLFEGKYADKIKKLILLAPFDIKTSFNTYGESVNLSEQTKNSWINDSDFSKIFSFFDSNYSYPILNKIQIPVKIIVGSKDIFFHPSDLKHPENAMDILLKNIKNSDGIVIEDLDHSYNPYPEKMVDEVLKFIK
jgi:predicted alpha/beta-fold hydrolase